MNCDKCNGRVLLDRGLVNRDKYEIYCLLCGKRDFIDKLSDIGRYITKQEFQLSLSVIGDL